MVLRISLWALLGLAVACGWIYYGMTAGANDNIGGWTVVAITAPAMLIGRMTPLSYSTVAFINAAIYGVVGFLTEPLWKMLQTRTSSR
jgi:hypothetical protein